MPPAYRRWNCLTIRPLDGLSIGFTGVCLMDDLATLIRHLDDPAAKRILATVAQQRVRSGATPDLPASAETARDLAAAAEVAPDATPVSDGELARETLLLLAEEPD